LHRVLAGEVFSIVIVMLRDAARQIAGDADIQRAVAATCEQLDGRLFHLSRFLMGAGCADAAKFGHLPQWSGTLTVALVGHSMSE
jgi:hypothetical protein